MKQKLILVSIAMTALTAATPAGSTPAASREFFYVGGKYSGTGNEVMAGQMYVEVLRPQQVTRKYPLVFIHGASQTATNWMGTPDGRAGWADYFLGRGYIVCLVDQPARGRSAWHPKVNGPVGILTASEIERRFTAPEVYAIWPQAKKHTQWPSESDKKGRRGDPVFDAFLASQVEGLSSIVETETLVQAAGSALLDKLGPSIVITHSQSGSFGWLLGDSRPKAVKGIVAIEPAGPPFRNSVFNQDKARPWGLTNISLSYDPPIKSAEELKPNREQSADGPDLDVCWKQADPPRRLPNLAGIPIAIVTAEASYHAFYDHCTSKYLTRAGVKNTLMRLGDEGVHGNGHMVMIERNSLEVAAAIQKWIAANVK